MTSIIKRETDNSKGFDTQVYRAIGNILDKVEEGFEQVYCAVELEEDVFTMVVDEDQAQTELEEDKNYSSKFSFCSPAVKNTLVSFFDQYMIYKKDSKLSLVMYAQTEATNEVIKQSIVDKSVDLVDKDIGKQKILLKLGKQVELSEDELRIALSIFKSEYSSQYKDRKDKATGYLDVVKDLDINSFKSFLRSIEWNISPVDNQDLEEVALKKIQECQFYNYMVEAKEELILGSIFHELSKKKAKEGFTSKLFNKSDLEIIFLKASTDSSVIQDHSYKSWSQIDTADIRKLGEKVVAVCPNFPEKRIRRLYDKIKVSKIEEHSIGKDYLSLKVRVLNKCSDILDDIIEGDKSLEIKEVKEIFNKLEAGCYSLIDQLKTDYNYKVCNEQTIQGIIFALFDECYLALDEI